MRRPSAHAMLVGQPFIAAAIQVFGGGMVILFWRIGWDGFWPGFVTCCVMAETGRAYEAVKTYKRWIAACDEVDGAPRRPSFRTYVELIIGCAVVFGVVAVLSVRGNASVAVGWLVVLSAVALPIWLLRRLLRRRGPRRGKFTPVAVIARCAMQPVPLAKAFALLPEHCQRILTRPQP